MRRSSLLLAPLLSLACSSSPPPPPTSPQRPAETQSAPLEIVDDARTVRCGVDDRPRSVVSQLDDPAPRAPGSTASEAPFVGDRIAGAPAVRFDPMPPMPPPPRASFVRGSPRALDGASLSRAAVEALMSVDPQYEVCAPLAEPGDSGQHELAVRFSSSGTPLDVRAERGEPSRGVRCLMERTCQLRVPAGQGAAAIVPLEVRLDAPPPPPPPPPPLQLPPQPSLPAPNVDVVLESPASSASSDAAIDVRRVFAETARRCGVGRALPTRTRVTFDAQVSRAGRGFRTQQVTTRSEPGGVDRALLACVIADLSAAPRASILGRLAPRVSVTVVWNP